MSIEAATLRLNNVLGDLEAKLGRRLDTLEADNARLRDERDRFESEIQTLKIAVAAAQAVPASDFSAERYTELEKSNAAYRTTLAQTLRNIDSLISRVASAEQ
jgi:predicted RNase H-like nuclease (RuvC/YqgF family)